MALKADRQIDSYELGYFLNETADRGVVVSISTAGSGVAMDNLSNLATVAANSSGAKPLGVLLNEFVNIDQTKFNINWHKDQRQVGDKAVIATKGWVVTNKVVLANAGSGAILTSSGFITNKPHNNVWNSVAQPEVGRFRSDKDEAGFAKVYIDL